MKMSIQFQERRDVNLVLTALLEASENENFSETLQDHFYNLYHEVVEQVFDNDFTPTR